MLEAAIDSILKDGKPMISQFTLPMVYAGEWRLEGGDAATADSLARMARVAAIVGDSLGDIRSGLAGRADLLSARAKRALEDRRGAAISADRAVVALRSGYGPTNRWTLEAVALRDSLER